jgi:hypothetical protein
MARVVEFSKLAEALQKFAYANDGKLPADLSELDSRYIKEGEIPPCVYLGKAGFSREVLAYEHDNEVTRKIGRRIIIPAVFGVKELSEADVQILLSGSGSRVLERARYERVVYYKIELAASLNKYRRAFGQYPQGGNASVTRELGEINPSNVRFHYRILTELSADGEELDPWGKPYFIKVDGDVARIKSAGSNGKFDLPSDPDFDDSCTTVAGGSEDRDGSRF